MDAQDRQGVNATLGETPERLRILEKGWRARRRTVLGETERINEETKVYRGAQPLGKETERTTLPKRRSVDSAQRQPRQMVSQRPLTPPPTPPLPPALHPTPARTKKPLSDPAKPLPVTRGYLPPTARPLPLPRSDSTIHVLPASSAYEMIISPTRHQDIRIRQGGREMYMRDHRERSPGKQVTIKLDDCTTWSAQEASQWKSVSQLVDAFKRTSSRIKIWHELGRLTVSCSDPPDIVLAYETCPLSAKWSNGLEVARLLTQTRLRYSPLTLSLQLDTLMSRSTPADGSLRDTLRVQRRVSLSALPTSEDVYNSSPDRIRQACRGLGVVPVEWREEELEAIARLWTLRPEWERYL